MSCVSKNEAMRSKGSLPLLAAALCACLVGCGDAGASGTQANAKQVEYEDAPRVRVYSPEIGPQLLSRLPVLRLDGEAVPLRKHPPRPIRISGQRKFSVELPESIGNIHYKELEGSKDAVSSYFPGGTNVIKPGNTVLIGWYRHEDPKDAIRLLKLESIRPGVYAQVPTVSMENGILRSSVKHISIDELPIGNVLYWEEHRTNTKKLVGFDLAFEIFDDALLESLPTLSDECGTIDWHPLTDIVDARSLNVITDFEHGLGYGDVRTEPNSGIVKPGENPECAIQVNLEENSTVVRLSMRCWPQKLDVNLMRIEFHPTTCSPNDDDLKAVPLLDVYLPKSPFKAEGFELPELQEAAKSE